jgi:hypothetical protein
MLMAFFDPNEFPIVGLLPQERSLTAVSFAKNLIFHRLTGLLSSWEIAAVASCIYISTILRATLLGMSKNR